MRKRTTQLSVSLAVLAFSSMAGPVFSSEPFDYRIRTIYLLNPSSMAGPVFSSEPLRGSFTVTIVNPKTHNDGQLIQHISIHPEKFVKTGIAGGNGTHDTAMAVIRKIGGLADNGSDSIAEMINLTHDTYTANDQLIRGSAGGNGSGGGGGGNVTLFGGVYAGSLVGIGVTESLGADDDATWIYASSMEREGISFWFDHQGNSEVWLQTLESHEYRRAEEIPEIRFVGGGWLSNNESSWVQLLSGGDATLFSYKDWIDRVKLQYEGSRAGADDLNAMDVLGRRWRGDANRDGVVTGTDLIVVQQNFGLSVALDGLLDGDANDDGQVTGMDLIEVQQNFGQVEDWGDDVVNILTTKIPNGTGQQINDSTDAAVVAAVPEPATIALISAGLLFMRKTRRTR